MRDYTELSKSVHCCVGCEESQCEICPRGGTPFSYIECKRKLSDDAADAIEELLAAVPTWISVEDEPPKENGRYLVRYKRDVDLGDEETVHEDEIRIMRFFVGDGWHYPIICNDHVRLVSEEVTHWMPLPSTEGLNEA